MQSSSNDTPQPTGAPASQTPSGGKLVWHTPAVEEVPFTRTEAGGAGAVYDFTVYAGSV
ncbi:MAG TPA: hypothetical protein VK420_02775 [Longimicrobium sp.]|jgi:hypothetical protein|nr:hypothetical protein [Longimicrobium sp.]